MAGRIVVVALVAVALASPTAASASVLVDRNAVAVRLAVNERGEALLTYRVGVAYGACSHPARSMP